MIIYGGLKMGVKSKEGDNKYKNKSLVKKILTAIMVILVICQLGVVAMISHNAKKTTKTEMDYQITKTLQSVALHIDGDELETFIQDKLTESNVTQTAIYVEEIKTYLRKVQKECDFKYVYLVGKFDDGKMHYVIDPDVDKESGEAFGDLLELGEGNVEYTDEENALVNGAYITDPTYYGESEMLTSGYLTIYNSKDEPIALLAADILGNDYEKALDKLGIDALAITVFCSIIICILLGLYIKRALKPLVHIQEVAVSISEGNVDVLIEKITQDEIGITARAINKMATTLKAMIRDISDNSNHLLHYSTQLAEHSKQFTISSEQVTSDVTHIAESAEEQLNQLDLISQKVDRINEEILGVVTQSQKATQDINTSYDYAQKGELMIKDSSSKVMVANESMENSKVKLVELKEEITKISSFVQVINGIAKQTNLLALNAAIESSRAGEAGKGFAVVADEVRNLANQSQEAANEIVTLLKDINISSTDVVSAIDQTFSQLQESVQVSKDAETYFYNILDANNNVKTTVSQVIKGINVCSSETKGILEAVQEVNENATSLVASCQNISAVTEEQYATSEEIMTSAMALSAMAKKLQESVEQFSKG